MSSKGVKKSLISQRVCERVVWLDIIIASFINQDPEWLLKVTKQASVEAGTGTDVSCLPVQSCYHSQGVDQSSQLLISHLPHATSHEHKYFVGVLSSCSLCARLLFFLRSQPLLITQFLSDHIGLRMKVTRHPSRECSSMWICILSFWSQGFF